MTKLNQNVDKIHSSPVTVSVLHTENGVSIPDKIVFRVDYPTHDYSHVYGWNNRYWKGGR